MAAVGFKLDRRGSREEKPILVILTHQSRNTKFSTGIKVSQKKWNDKKQEPKGTDQGSVDLRDKLYQIKQKLEVSYIQYHIDKTDQVPTIEDLKNYFVCDRIGANPDSEKPKTLRVLINQFINQNTTYRSSTHTIYKGLHSRITMFCEKYNKTDYIKEIDRSWLEKFAGFLAYDSYEMKGHRPKEPMENGSVRKLLSRISSVLNDMEIDHKINFKKIKEKYQEAKNSDKTAMPHCSTKEVMKIYEYQPDLNVKLKARDLYVFCCFAGLRHNELYQVSDKNIVTRHHIDENDKYSYKALVYVSSKTDSVNEVPLNDICLEIIDRWRGQKMSSDQYKKPEYEECLLPVMANQLCNKYLHRILQDLGWDEHIRKVRKRGGDLIETYIKKYNHLTFHSSRHTFACYMLENGASLELIKTLLGHETIRTTEKWYAKANITKTGFEAYKIDKMARKVRVA